MHPLLCINGSDSMGNSGIQADIRTIKDFGGHAVTAVTSVTIQNSQGIVDILPLNAELVKGQVKAVCDEMHPEVVKVGMINDPETIREVRQEIVGCRHIVCSPVILPSYGGLLMSNEAIQAFCQYLIPICTLLIIKCIDAEIILGHRICTDNDMIEAATHLRQMGAEWILLRGGTYSEGRINALLFGPSHTAFFSSVNIEGWQRHGVGGTLSTAIAARLSMGDNVEQAVAHAHSYLHSQVVYASSPRLSLQPHSLYDRFMSLLSGSYATAHDVSHYASALHITTRYLSQITNTVSGRAPKQIIDDFLTQKSEQLLSNTSLSIQQISNQLGFSSQIAFAKFFKARKGCSPTTYRSGIRLHQVTSH